MRRLAPLMAIVTNIAIASPGDDSCVGNCAPNPSNGSSSGGPVEITSSNLNSSKAASHASSLSSASSDSAAHAGSVSTSVGQGGAGGIGYGGQGGSGGHGGSGYGGVASAAGGSSTAAGGSASVDGVSTTASNSLTIEQRASRAAHAPDVLTAPTAPCRVSWGGSAGWLGGALGIGGSTLDEGCDLRETSRHLYNVGQRDAAVQVMCLHEGARKALEAVGVECKMSLQR